MSKTKTGQSTHMGWHLGIRLPALTALIASSTLVWISLPAAIAAGRQTETAPAPAPLPMISQPLSLSQAVALALKHSPQIRGAQQDVLAANAGISAAEADGKLSVSGSLFGAQSSPNGLMSSPGPISPVNLMAVPNGTFLDASVGAMLPIYSGGRVSSAVLAARDESQASGGDLSTTQQNVALLTRVAYRRALYQRALVTAQQRNLDASQAEFALDSERYNAGKLAEVFLFRDRSAVANAQQAVTNANRDWMQALYGLLAVMGIDLRSQVELTDALNVPSATGPATQAGESTVAPADGQGQPAGGGGAAGELMPGVVPSAATQPMQNPPALPDLAAAADDAGLTRLLQQAATQRPELLAARQRINAAQSRVDLAKAGFKPQVNLVGMGGLSHGDARGSSGSSYTVGVTVGLPLFEGGALSAAQSEAEARLEKAKQAYQTVDIQVQNEVRDALLSLAAAKQNLATSESALEQAREDYDIQVVRFNAGKGIQVEVLDALAARTAAETQVDQAAYDYAVAQDQAARATGTILTAN
jgi:outer membrane protein TolC